MKVQFFAAGVPQPQGSTRAFVVKGRAVTTSDNPKVKDWRLGIRYQAQAHFCDLVPGSVDIDLVFVMPRPKSLPKTRTVPHTKRPDLDKLIRSSLDSMTGVIYGDDAAVDRIRAWKRYAAVGEQPGVLVTVEWEA